MKDITPLDWILLGTYAALAYWLWYKPRRRQVRMRRAEVDPTPWCHGCGAPTQADCKCGPIAEND